MIAFFFSSVFLCTHIAVIPFCVSVSVRVCACGKGASPNYFGKVNAGHFDVSL